MDLFDHPGATSDSPGIPSDFLGAPRNMVAPNDLSGAQSVFPDTQNDLSCALSDLFSASAL